MYTMKTFLFAGLMSFIGIQLNAQADLCDNCYVWEFATDNGERDQTTRVLSNDVEDILSQYSGCKVLQRSRFARLQEQVNTEKAIQSLNTVSDQIKSELKTIQAKRVIFGTVNRDFQGNVSLRLSFENLQTSQVKSNTVFLINEDYYNFDKRKEKLTSFINSFVNPEGKLASPTQSGEKPKTSSVDCPKDNMPYALENANFKVSFCQCYYYNSIVTCPLWVVNKSAKIQNLKIYGGKKSRLIVDYGNVFLATGATLMDASKNSSGYAGASIPVTRNGVPASITFDNVTTKSKTIESLEIATGFETKSFQDVPLVYGPPPKR